MSFPLTGNRCSGGRFRRHAILYGPATPRSCRHSAASFIRVTPGHPPSWRANFTRKGQVRRRSTLCRLPGRVRVLPYLRPLAIGRGRRPPSACPAPSYRETAMAGGVRARANGGSLRQVIVPIPPSPWRRENGHAPFTLALKATPGASRRPRSSLQVRRCAGHACPVIDSSGNYGKVLSQAFGDSLVQSAARRRLDERRTGCSSTR